MRCSQCGSLSSVVQETKRATFERDGDGLRRRRICRCCGHSWSTTEREDRYDQGLQSWVGHKEPTLPPIPKKAKRKASTKPAAFYPVGMADAASILVGIPPAIAADFLEWWNASRRSKHGTQAAWTERAFRHSADRVRAMPEWAQKLLVTAGIEHGWQALNPAYIQSALDKGQPRNAVFRPRSSGLAGALSLIEGGHGTA